MVVSEICGWAGDTQFKAGSLPMKTHFKGRVLGRSRHIRPGPLHFYKFLYTGDVAQLAERQNTHLRSSFFRTDVSGLSTINRVVMGSSPIVSPCFLRCCK